VSDAPGPPMERLLHDLKERAKELACLYRVEELLGRGGRSLEETLGEMLAVLPDGWQFPAVTVARVRVGEASFAPPGFAPTPWRLTAPIRAGDRTLGVLEVYYTEARPEADEGPFLAEERKLLESVAERVGGYLAQRAIALPGEAPPAGARADWHVILEFLRHTDRILLGRLGRKMVNQLCWSGIAEAEELLRRIAPPAGELDSGDENRPLPRRRPTADAETTEAAFRIAAGHLGDAEIQRLIESWIREEKTTFLKHAVERSDTPLPELVEAIQRFRHSGVAEEQLSLATQTGLRASLARRFLTDDVGFVEIAKQVFTVDDFHELTQRMVTPARSHGKIGGKAAGLFLAGKVLERAYEFSELLGGIRVPRSWYVPSDGLLDFITHNDLNEVHNRKYLEPERIRLEYPHLVQLFKNSFFAPEILRGLSTVLDELADRPIIVRSSSLLEDRLGSAFSGKYKSLFLANTGGKPERLAALTDAIAEVYASVFSPDPIEYRARRGSLDLHEEMGILIQEVVGSRVGRYFLPSFSGVGFSNNEFRWSPRIRRDDGLLRLVPGLGTRAVDRLSDDYPILVAPGQPGLRVNQTADEALRYSPKQLDAINLESGAFETVDVREFLAAHGADLPLARRLVSIVDHDRLRRPTTAWIDFAREDLVVSFDGLLAETTFVPRMKAVLDVLRERLGTPVDVEFACDGDEIYLLQCRPQGSTGAETPAAIPADPAPERVLFTAHRHVSNGRVGDLSHIVYVDPDAYGELEQRQLREVGRAIGRLNRVLPKRGFVLMGPGRWGSRGDIRLGVPVTYADISNTALLVEIARQRGGYVPDLSFGTHFFQDLVESSIRYLPLFPEDPEVEFAEAFFRTAPNELARLAPEFASLDRVVRVIDVRRASGGMVLRVLMNGELDRAIGLLVPAETEGQTPGAAAAG
jgi:pyruvate, water dikinase